VEGFTFEMNANIRVRRPGDHYVFRRLAMYGKGAGFATGGHALASEKVGRVAASTASLVHAYERLYGRNLGQGTGTWK